MSNFNTLANKELLAQTMEALEKNNIRAYRVSNAKEALAKALELIPEGREVLTNASVTVDTIGLSKEINEGTKYISINKKKYAMDLKTQMREFTALSASADVAVGSAHAVSKTGTIHIASMSGSNLPGYAFGSSLVVLVVSTKKITNSDAEASERIWKHVLPQESARARKAYNLPPEFNSNPNLILSIAGQSNPGRIHVIFVEEDLGF